MVKLLKHITDCLQISPTGQIIFYDRPLLNFMEFSHRTGEDDKAQLKKQLTDLLYEHFYKAHEPKETGNRNFLDDLRKNNLSRARIRKGYTLEIVQEIPYTASKGAHRLKLQPGTYLLPGEENAGAEAWVRLPKDRVKDSFYYAFSRMPAAFFRESVLRFYFNTGIEGSVLLMNYLTGNLNRARIPFVLKCIYESRHIHRPDNFVLYTDYRFVGHVYLLIREIPESLSACLYPATPLFTLALRPGIGFAESPYDPQKSFGTARCELLAEALTEIRTGAESRLQEMITRIEQKEYDLKRFFLNPGSKLVYPFF